MSSFSSRWKRSRISNARSARVRSPTTARRASGPARPAVRAPRGPDRHGRDAELRSQVADAARPCSSTSRAMRAGAPARTRGRDGGGLHQGPPSCDRRLRGSRPVSTGTIDDPYRNCQQGRLKPNESCGMVAEARGVRRADSSRPVGRAPPRYAAGARDPDLGWGEEATMTVTTPRARRSRPPQGRSGSSCRLGLRKLRHALQGLRPEGRPARSVREGRRRGAGPPLHRRRADRRAAYPVDKVEDYAGLARTPLTKGSPRDDQLEHVPGRRLHARERLPPRCACAGQGGRPPARVRRHHG